MSYKERISKGCNTCRARKIKCDETRPVCHKCARSGKNCEGYRDLLSLGFRSFDPSRTETGKTHEALNESRKIIETLNFERRSNLDSGRKKSILQHHEQVIDPKKWNESDEDEAVTRFFSAWILPKHAKPSKVPYLGHLPDLYAQARLDSVFSRAVAAVSLAFLANTKKDQSLRVKAESAYEQTLKLLISTLAPPLTIEHCEQEILASIMLGMYELITLGETDIPKWDTHFAGALALLEREVTSKSYKRRKANKNYSPPTGAIEFASIALYHYSLVLAFARGKSISPILMDLVSKVLSEDEPALNVATIARNVVEIHTKMAEIFNPQAKSDNSRQIEKLQRLINTITSTDAQSCTWSSSASDSWSFSINLDHAIDSWDSYFVSEYTYTSVWIAMVWNIYRTARIILSQCLIKCIDYLGKLLDQEGVFEPVRGAPKSDVVEKSRELTLHFANEICNTVRFSLGKSTSESIHDRQELQEPQEPNSRALGGYFLMWPLNVVLTIDFLPQDQKHWIQYVLCSRVGENLGIKSACRGIGDRNTLEHLESDEQSERFNADYLMSLRACINDPTMGFVSSLSPPSTGSNTP